MAPVDPKVASRLAAIVMSVAVGSSIGSMSPKPAAASSSVLTKTYLFLHNLISFVAWSYVLVLTFTNLTDPSSFYARVRYAVVFAQFLAIFEVLQSVFGLVSSPAMTVCVQVGSRWLVLYGVVEQVQSVQTNWCVAMLCVAWSCAEVPRYLYYAVNSFGSVPYPLLWLRYSGFLILYPMGFVAETLCIYNSLGFFFKTQQWSIAMPNVWNFEFSWARLLQLIIALYVPGSPFMFLHMCRQRVKYLSGRTRTPLPSSKMMERKSSFKSKKAD